MQITNEQLRRIIAEEFDAVMKEQEELEEGKIGKFMAGIGLMFAMVGSAQAGTDDVIVGSNSTSLPVENIIALDHMMGAQIVKGLNDNGQYVTGKNLVNYLGKQGVEWEYLDSKNMATAAAEKTKSNSVELTYTQQKDGTLVSVDVTGHDGITRPFSFKIADKGADTSLKGHKTNLEQIEAGMAPVIDFLQSKTRSPSPEVDSGYNP